MRYSLGRGPSDWYLATFCPVDSLGSVAVLDLTTKTKVSYLTLQLLVDKDITRSQVLSSNERLIRVCLFKFI